MDPRAPWDRMEGHGISQDESARLAVISSSMLSQIINDKQVPAGGVLRRLYDALFRPSAAELVVPAEVKALAWKKGWRNGVVPAASPSEPGRVTWGAEVEYAYRAGYDSRGRLSVTHPRTGGATPSC